jgi:hypothetical protein
MFSHAPDDKVPLSSSARYRNMDHFAGLDVSVKETSAPQTDGGNEVRVCSGPKHQKEKRARSCGK